MPRQEALPLYHRTLRAGTHCSVAAAFAPAIPPAAAVPSLTVHANRMRMGLLGRPPAESRSLARPEARR